MLSSSLFKVAALVAAASSVDAFWRLPCNNVLVTERADSIVSPGAISGHTHTILGGSNFGLSTSFQDLRASECTSCLVKQDMSNYWTPQLYFQWANGSFSSLTTGGGLIYYLPRNHSSDTTEVKAFPDGLKMLIGNPFKRSYNASSDADQAIGWNCLGGPVPTGTDTRQPYLPPYNCPDNLRGELRFPSCWNGKDLDSSDHFSHMAYPIGGESGPCPTGFPVRVVTLFYEISWPVQNWNSYRSQALNPTQPFVLANGDSSGYGYHGDFFNGWDGDILQQAIRECTSDSGIIDYCTIFDLYDDTDQCRQTPQVDEVVLGLLPSLPGCNPITGAGANAAPCAASSTPSIVDNVVYTTDAPPAGAIVPGNEPAILTSYTNPATNNVWAYQDCYADLVNNVRALTNGLTNTAKTVEGCLAACDAKNYTLCGIEYHGECWGANTLDASSKALGAGACGLVCDGNNLQYCGGSTNTLSSAGFELYSRSSVAITTSASVSAAATGTTSAASIPVSSAAASSASTTTTITTTSTVAASTTVSSTIASTSSATAAAASVSGKVASAGWTYSGCYSDLVSSKRTLTKLLSPAKWAASSCQAAAAAAGYKYAGVEYGGECWGGNTIGSTASLLPATSCAKTCNDAAGTTCGGTGALDIYVSMTATTKTRRGPPARLDKAGIHQRSIR